MGTTGFVDMLLYIKKHLKMIIAFALLGAFGAFILAQVSQSYTATVSIQYMYDGAADEVDPLGNPLNVYEIMSPALVSNALKKLESDLSVEEVRSQLSVSPVIRTTESELQQAKTALGEGSEVKTNNYNVSYTCEGALGQEFAQHLLYQLLQEYDAYFSQQYLQMNRIPDFMNIVDVEAMDYMEKCEYIEGQLLAITSKLEGLIDENGDFTSLTTGLDFAALRSFYVNLRENQYDRLYANVRQGLLTKNKNLLIQGYEKRIEDMRLNSINSEAQSQQAYDMVTVFYDQYKKNNLYYQARSTQVEVDDSDDDNKNLVYNYDLSLMINTYDDILLRYINTGVNATNLQHDISYYQNLIEAFRGDTMTAAQKQPMYTAADALLEEITATGARYAELANQTLADYYKSKIANSVKYMMAVEVSPGVSTMMYIVVGVFIMALGACALAIIIEVVRAQIERRKMENLQLNDDGSLPPDIVENMQPIERAFYEQAMTGFTEFYLMYQPMVSKGKWCVAESLVRWESKRYGQIYPDTFLPIAEKYLLMERLGEWILKTACTQSLKWERGGRISPFISVNYSTQQIESQSFIDSICRIVTEMGVNPENIFLEISGGGELKNVETISAKFKALNALGVRLAIDRFGDAISSMRVLYELPAYMVKLDKRFMDALKDPKDKNASFLKQVMGVCRERDLKICVCGVEEMWQAERLKDMNVDYEQGYYYSSPLPAAAYEARYAANETMISLEDDEEEGGVLL